MSRYTIRELVEKSGIAKRRIRYLIEEGLIAKPDRGGRGALYAEEHLIRLRQIKRLDSTGLTMDQLRERVGPAVSARAAPSQAIPAFRIPRHSVRASDALAHDARSGRAEIYRRVVITPEIELHVKGGSAKLAAGLERALRLAIRDSTEGGEGRSDQKGSSGAASIEEA